MITPRSEQCYNWGGKGKENLLQAWKDPEVSRWLRLSAQGGGKVASPTHRPSLPQ